MFSPGALSESQRQQLLPALIAVSSAAFGVDTEAVWRQRIEESWFERVERLFLVHDPAGQVVGWTSYRRAALDGERILYMDSTGVAPAHQRRGLIPRIQSRTILSQLAARPLRPLHVVYRTRNPVVWRGLRRRLGDDKVAPPISGGVQMWARRLAPLVDRYLAEPGELDPELLVIRGAYSERPAAVYGEEATPRTGDPGIDQFFDRALGPEDALLVIARATLLRLARP